MKISLIAAMAKNRVIGLNNTMPWHLPADLAHFKALTLNKPIIMGRKTYLSIGRVLPGRKNIILTRDKNFHVEGGFCAQTIEQALQHAGDDQEIAVAEVVVIGGAEIYQQFIEKATCLYLTLIDLDTKGDTYFPDYNRKHSWRVHSKKSHKADEKNLHDYEFICLEKNR